VKDWNQKASTGLLFHFFFPFFGFFFSIGFLLLFLFARAAKLI